jgi:hypothetical protein
MWRAGADLRSPVQAFYRVPSISNTTPPQLLAPDGRSVRSLNRHALNRGSRSACDLPYFAEVGQRC